MIVNEPKTILLVEDEIVNAMLTSKIIKSFGYNVVNANSGLEAIDIFKKNVNIIDLILMDIDLGSGIDGTETAVIILKDHDVPVVFLSSHTEPEIVEKTEKITSYGYVVKGSGRTVLDASIKMAFKLFEALKNEKKKEHALRKSQHDLLGSQRLAHLGSWHLDIATNEVFWTEELYKMYGFDPSLPPPPYTEHMKLFTSESWETLTAALVKTRETGIPYELELKTVRTDGRNGWMWVRGEAVVDEDGNTIGLWGAAQDITERKLIEIKLDETQAILKAAMDQSTAGIAIANADGSLRYVNDAGLLIRGGSREEIVNGVGINQYVSNWKLLDLDGIPLKTEEVPLARAVLYGETNHREFIIRRDNDEDRVVMANATPIKNNDDKVVASVEVFIDITERKIAEEKLYESETKLNNILTNISDVVWSLSWPDFNVLYLSPSIEKLYGRGAPEFIKNTNLWLEVTHPDDRHMIDKALETLKKEGVATRECRIIQPDGSIKWIYDKSKLIYDQSHMPVRVEGIASDITQRKQAEKALRESEALLNETGAIAKIGGWKIDLQTQQLTWSKEVFKLHEVTDDFQPTVENAINFYDSDSKHTIQKAVEEAIQLGIPFDVELGIITAKNNHINVRALGNIQKDINGQAIIINGTFQDITDRKRLQDAIQEKEARLCFAMETSRLGVWDLDLVNHSAIRSLEHDRIFGYKELLPQWTYEMFLEHVLPEDRAMVNGKFQEAMKISGEWNFECRIRRADDKVRWIWAAGRHQSNSDKNSKRMAGIVQDITEFKNIQEALSMSEARLRKTIENAPFPIMIHAEDGRVEMINNTWIELTGYTIADIPTTADWTEKAYGERHKVVKNYIDELYNLNGKKNEGDYLIKTRNGNFIVWDFSSAPLGKLPDGRRAVISMAKDVTERKQTEEKIKTLLAEKELLLKEVHHRIKNNMNTVAGIMTMQLDTLNEPSVVAALKDARSRVQSMMILYDKLYRSDDFNKISFKDYFTPLVDEIIGNFPNREMVKTEKIIDDFMIDAKRLSPLGIIINELLTNIMKYAFVRRGNGLITFSAAVSDGRVTISVGDNGIGIPESVDFSTADSFGLQLVYMMTRQLRAAVKIERNNGTKFILEFNL